MVHLSEAIASTTITRSAKPRKMCVDVVARDGETFTGSL